MLYLQYVVILQDKFKIISLRAADNVLVYLESNNRDVNFLAAQQNEIIICYCNFITAIDLVNSL